MWRNFEWCTSLIFDQFVFDLGNDLNDLLSLCDESWSSQHFTAKKNNLNSSLHVQQQIGYQK